MQLPRPRGPRSTAVVAYLDGSDPKGLPADVPGPEGSPITDEDLQTALWTCYELHYRGFAGVPDDLEWDPALLAFRRHLEEHFLAGLRSEVTVPPGDGPVPERLKQLVADFDGPPLSRYMRRDAMPEQFGEFAIHRSIYQLKDADPHSFALPRLAGRAKAALVEIQADEYGGGVEKDMHAQLYRATMRGLGLSDEYGHYADAVPAVTLALSNAMSLFGLHRSLRGALAGHLAAFEMTSSEPNRRYSLGLQRIGADEATRRFHDVHVMADALHEQIAAYDLCGGLVADEPELADDVLFGAASCLFLDARLGSHLLECWQADQSSLLNRSGASPSCASRRRTA
jgi:hypothetical protein